MSLPQVDTAMILAAGLGTRMRPITNTIPKPLVPVLGKPMMGWTIERLKEAGVRRVVVNTHYLPEQIEAYCNTRKDIEIHLSHEAEVLETGGGVVKALKLLGEKPFFIANCDILWLDGYIPLLERLKRHWDDARADMLLAVHPAARAVGYEGRGDFIVGQNAEARLRYEREVAPFVFAGVQLAHPRLFKGLKAERFSLNRFFRAPSLTAQGWLERIRALPHDGEWLHIGDPAGLAKAEKALRLMGFKSL